MRKRIILAVALLAVVLPTHAIAQTATQQDEPATKFEKILLTKGTMAVREYYSLGAMSGKFEGKISFEVARTYVPGSASQAAMALRVHVKEGGRLERERIGVLDREEVTSFGKAIPEMVKMAEALRQSQNPTVSDDGSTEVVFSGGSVRFTVFVGRKEGDGLSVQAGTIGSTQIFLDLSDFSLVGALVSQAIAKMQALDQKR